MAFSGQLDHYLNFINKLTLFKTITFDICFVDQGTWLGRHETIKHFANKAKFIILHDCDYFTREGVFGTTIKALDVEHQLPGIYNFSDVFKYFKVYFPAKPWPGPNGPPTLLGSNFVADFPEVDFNNY